MTRSIAREIAVHLSFELGFSNLSAEELLDRSLTREHFERRSLSMQNSPTKNSASTYLRW